MDYIYVENGIVDKTKNKLPKIWGNISNFNVLSDEELLKFGWYKLVQIPLNIIPDDEIIIRWEFIVHDTYVEHSPITRKKTESEILNSYNFELQKKWNLIRQKRDKLLLESDWTQLDDSPITLENKLEWAEYRQKLRDITDAKSPEHVKYPKRPNYIKKEIQESNDIEMEELQNQDTIIEYYNENINSDFHYQYVESGMNANNDTYFKWKQIDMWDNEVPTLSLKGYDPDSKELLFTSTPNNDGFTQWLQSIDNENWTIYDGTQNILNSYIMVQSFAFEQSIEYVLVLSIL